MVSVIVTNPAEGQWQFRTYYFGCQIIGLTADNQDAQPLQPAAADTFDFIMNVSVQSTIQLEGRLLGLNSGKAEAGDNVDIAGFLLDKNGTLPATLMLAVVDGPGGTVGRVMFDDGNSGDGAAGDR